RQAQLLPRASFYTYLCFINGCLSRLSCASGGAPHSRRDTDGCRVGRAKTPHANCNRRDAVTLAMTNAARPSRRSTAAPASAPVRSYLILTPASVAFPTI